MFLLACVAEANAGGCCEHGSPGPLCAVVVLPASAARRLAWRPQRIRVRMRWGESLTQDSRSATEGACEVRDVDHSAMAVAATAVRARGGPAGAVTWFLELGHAAERRLIQAVPVLEGYVTGRGPVT